MCWCSYYFDEFPTSLNGIETTFLGKPFWRGVVAKEQLDRVLSAHSAGSRGVYGDPQLSTISVRIAVENLDDVHEKQMTLVVVVRKLETPQNPLLIASLKVPDEKADDKAVTHPFLELRKTERTNQGMFVILQCAEGAAPHFGVTVLTLLD